MMMPFLSESSRFLMKRFSNVMKPIKSMSVPTVNPMLRPVEAKNHSDMLLSTSYIIP